MSKRDYEDLLRRVADAIREEDALVRASCPGNYLTATDTLWLLAERIGRQIDNPADRQAFLTYVGWYER